MVGNPAHKIQNAHGVGSANVVNALGSKLRDAEAAFGEVHAPGWAAHLVVHYPNSFSATQSLACPEDDVAAAKSGDVADDQNGSRDGIARSAGLDRRRFGLARPQIVETKSALALASPLRRHHLAGHVSRSFRHLPSRISLAVSSSGHLFLLLPFSLETCQISGTYRLRTIT